MTHIEYQKGSIVSKTLVKKKGGSVTLFAFDGGQELSEHTAPFDAVAHVTEGSIDITVSGERSAVTAGETLIMPANEPHALKATIPAKLLLVMIKE